MVYICDSKVNKSFSNIALTVLTCRNPCSECIHIYSWVWLTYGDQSWLVSRNNRQDVSWVYLQALRRSNHHASKRVRGKNWWKLCILYWWWWMSFIDVIMELLDSWWKVVLDGTPSVLISRPLCEVEALRSRRSSISLLKQWQSKRDAKLTRIDRVTCTGHNTFGHDMWRIMNFYQVYRV